MMGKIYLALVVAIALVVSTEGCFGFGKRGESRRRIEGRREGRRSSFGEMMTYISLDDLPGNAGIGDVAKTRGGKNYIYTGDTYQSVIYHWRRVSRNLNFCESRLPFRGSRDIHVKVTRIGTVNGDWTGEKRVALAKRLLDRRLVSGHNHCSSEHYYDYIIYGRTYTTRGIPECPLARSLAGVSVNEINSGGFYLETSDGERLVVRQIPLYTTGGNSPPLSPDGRRRRSGSPSNPSDEE